MQWLLRGERVELRPDRTLWWPAAETLIAADVHLGKGPAFVRLGIPLPDAGPADLARLSAALAETGARRLLVLGDLVHARTGHEAALAAWDPPVERVLVAGNHDRGTVPAGFRVVDRLDEGPLRFRHAPEAAIGTVCGHLHPKAELRGGPRGMSAPCFWLHRETLVLPAFGSQTGGHAVRPVAGDRIAVVGHGTVIEARLR